MSNFLILNQRLVGGVGVLFRSRTVDYNNTASNQTLVKGIGLSSYNNGTYVFGNVETSFGNILNIKGITLPIELIMDKAGLYYNNEKIMNNESTIQEYFECDGYMVMCGGYQKSMNRLIDGVVQTKNDIQREGFMKFYFMEIFENDILTHDLHACKKNDKIGIFDTITNKFYPLMNGLSNVGNELNN